jgi:pimeloyl-ACP methyl ester carboxylesterase
MPGRDQYQVLRDIAHHVIEESKLRAQQRLNRPVTDWQIVTTGHSLGGGLAQLMAYKVPGVAAAVAFDPSPVTGFYTCVEDHEVNCNVPVWRIYARGEVLAYVRALMRKGYNLSENITEVEFDGVAGNPIHKHSMPNFLTLLQRAEGHQLSAQWQATGLFVASGDCQCMAQRQPRDWQAHHARCIEAWQQLAPTAVDWMRAREDALHADAMQRRLERLQLLTSPEQQISLR